MESQVTGEENNQTGWVPPFGLHPSEAETLIRLAAAACDEADPDRTWYFQSPLDGALMSFTDPEEVERLARETWAKIVDL